MIVSCNYQISKIPFHDMKQKFHDMISCSYVTLYIYNTMLYMYMFNIFNEMPLNYRYFGVLKSWNNNNLSFYSLISKCAIIV